MVQRMPAPQGCGNDKSIHSTNYFRSKWEHDPERGQSQNEQKRAEDALAAGVFYSGFFKETFYHKNVYSSLASHLHTKWDFSKALIQESLITAKHSQLNQLVHNTHKYLVNDS